MIKKLAVLLLAIGIGLPLAAQSASDLPALEGRVNDFAGLLDVSQKSILDKMLADFEAAKGSQVVVAIIPTTGDYVIEEYAIELAEAWKIGRKDVDDGVILVVAVNDRKLRIEVGYGLEGVLTDALCKRIIENVIVPQFRSGDYFGGIKAGLEVILSAVQGEELPPVVQESESDSSDTMFVFGFIVAIVVGLMICGAIVRSVGKSKAKWILFAIGLILGWIFISFIVGIIFGFIAMSFAGGSSGARSVGTGGMFYGGGFSSSSGSDYSDSGFSGGGGDFGGGGASGDW